MKTKLKEFIQYLSHEIEDEEKAEQYLNNALPFIGLIVMYFNALESSLNSVLCENFTDRSDSTGLIVLNKMNYSAKVDLFKRFCDDFQLGMACKLDGYDKLIEDLNESAKLRNLIVHANWESTDEEGYTYVRLKMTKQGMQQVRISAIAITCFGIIRSLLFLAYSFTLTVRNPLFCSLILPLIRSDGCCER